jgi:hypothetical protein
MTPEQLVPSLELCQRAQGLGYPQGESYFTWFCGLGWSLVSPTLWHKEHGKLVDAPTLQEVLEDIFASGYRVPTLYSAEAALELWCELEERKRE